MFGYASSYPMHTPQTEIYPQSFSGISANPKWHWPQNPKAPRHNTAHSEQTETLKKTTLANGLCWGLREGAFFLLCDFKNASFRSIGEFQESTTCPLLIRPSTLNILHGIVGIFDPLRVHYNPFAKVIFFKLSVCSECIILDSQRFHWDPKCHLGIWPEIIWASRSILGYPNTCHIGESVEGFESIQICFQDVGPTGTTLNYCFYIGTTGTV